MQGPVSRTSQRLFVPEKPLKNQETLHVQSFIFQQILDLNKACTFATFRIQEPFLFFSYKVLKLALRAWKVCGTFDKRDPGALGVFEAYH